MKPYPSYKNSGVKWIREIPTGWGAVKLKYVGKLYGGITGKSGNDFNNEERDNNKYYIPYTNILNNKYILTDNFGLVSIEENEKQNNVEKNDLFFLMSSETVKDVGKSSVLVEAIDDLYLNSFCKGFRLYGEGVSSVFLNHLLSGHLFRETLSIEGRGFTRINLKQDRIYDLLVFQPPMQEQQLIANYLNNKTQKIGALIEKTQQKIELLKEQRVSLINHVVTKGLNPDVELKDSGVEWIGEIPSSWETRRIWSLGRFSKGRGIKKDEVKENGIPCIRYGEIYTRYERVVYLPKSFIDDDTSLKSKPIKKGSVLFTASGELLEEIGKAVVYYGDNTVYAGGDIIILQLNDDSDPLFISYLMNSHTVNSQKTQSGRGGIIVHIYAKQLNEIRITLPPIQEQQQIVEYLDKNTGMIDAIIKKESKRIELLKEYRQSLISEIVTGKIDIRDEVAA